MPAATPRRADPGTAGGEHIGRGENTAAAAVATGRDATGKAAALAAGHVAGKVAVRTVGRTVAGGGNLIVGFAVEQVAASAVVQMAERGTNGRETSLQATGQARKQSIRIGADAPGPATATTAARGSAEQRERTPQAPTR